MSNMMVAIFVLGCIGYFCLGALWQVEKVQIWRIRWIKLEYDLARLQNRKPRDISEVENERP